MEKSKNIEQVLVDTLTEYQEMLYEQRSHLEREVGDMDEVNRLSIYMDLSDKIEKLEDLIEQLSKFAIVV